MAGLSVLTTVAGGSWKHGGSKYNTQKGVKKLEGTEKGREGGSGRKGD